MSAFDWHSDRIDQNTPVDSNYKNTQNVRRFLKSQCGDSFKFNKPFMQWIKDGKPKTMGMVASEWTKQNPKKD